VFLANEGDALLQQNILNLLDTDVLTHDVARVQ
jgi:hypothetical protein